MAGTQHRAILTGDIDAEVEQKLALVGIEPHDVALVAHHGSSSSSALSWIKAVGAKHAVIQAGHYNRFGHPDADVVNRWRQHGARVWVSSWHGGVQFESTSGGLDVRHTRDERRRYWHEPPAPLQ